MDYGPAMTPAPVPLRQDRKGGYGELLDYRQVSAAPSRMASRLRAAPRLETPTIA